MKDNKKQFWKKLLIVVLVLITIIACFTLLNERPTYADSGFSTSHSSGGGGFSSGGSYSGSGGRKRFNEFRGTYYNAYYLFNNLLYI